MAEIKLQATARSLRGRKTQQLRDDGQVPAIVYGAGGEPINVSVNSKEFVNTYKNTGKSTLINLELDEASAVPVLIQDFQTDPIYNNVTHIDFRRVDMNKPITATVKLKWIGEPAAVREMGGTLVTARDALEITALPKDLVAFISVDLTKLKTFDDVIRIEDLELPPNVTVVDPPDLSIATVSRPRSEREMEALDEAVEADVSKIEVEGAGKEEAEGAEAAAEGTEKSAEEGK